MIVMPANSSGWFWHALARETGRLGHLYSPGGQRGPWSWFPYALDNGAYACWDKDNNTFDDHRWLKTERAWQKLMLWAQVAANQPRWAVVPDVPGDAVRTCERWAAYAKTITRVPLALAVQDGMTVEQVKALEIQPEVIAVGGSTDKRGVGGWKWETVPMWAAAFPRVHVLRCNSPTKLYELEALGIESCDGTGWNMGDRKQTRGIEEWARSRAAPLTPPLWPHVCRGERPTEQESFF